MKGDHIVANEIEQNYNGDTMCVPYSDDGNFRVLVFTNTGEKIVKLNMNDELGIDKKSRPIMGLFNPMIKAYFVKDGDLFVSIFHRMD